MLRVLREDPSLQVIDRLAEQRDQLAERHAAPRRRRSRTKAQRWVYYPWRRAVVRLLGPRSFGTLRLDRNRNKITRAEQARQRDPAHRRRRASAPGTRSPTSWPWRAWPASSGWPTSTPSSCPTSTASRPASSTSA